MAWGHWRYLWSCLLLSWGMWSFFWLLVSPAEGLEFAVRCWAVCRGCWRAACGVCQPSQHKHLSPGHQPALRTGPSSPGSLFLTQCCLIVQANSRCGFHWFRVPQRFSKVNQVDYCHPSLGKRRQFYKGHCFSPTAFFRNVLLKQFHISSSLGTPRFHLSVFRLFCPTGGISWRLVCIEPNNSDSRGRDFCCLQ